MTISTELFCCTLAGSFITRQPCPAPFSFLVGWGADKAAFQQSFWTLHICNIEVAGSLKDQRFLLSCLASTWNRWRRSSVMTGWASISLLMIHSGTTLSMVNLEMLQPPSVGTWRLLRFIEKQQVNLGMMEWLQKMDLWSWMGLHCPIQLDLEVLLDHDSCSRSRWQS